MVADWDTFFCESPARVWPGDCRAYSLLKSSEERYLSTIQANFRLVTTNNNQYVMEILKKQCMPTVSDIQENKIKNHKTLNNYYLIKKVKP